MVYTYPDNLVPYLKETWDEHIPSGMDYFSLPPKSQLTSFIEVAYHASMLTEEKRKIGFRLAFIRPEDAERQAGMEAYGRWFEPVRFGVQREFNVAEILRLAPATDHNKVLICVAPFPSNGVRGKKQLKIWALLDTGSSWSQFMHGESRIGTLPPNCLTISSTEPGNLMMSREGTILLKFKQGKVFKPSKQNLEHGPVGEFFRKAEEMLTDDVLARIEDRSEKVVSSVRRKAGNAYSRFFERILLQIQDLGHGGALLVIRDEDIVGDTLKDERLIVKYPVVYDRAWDHIANWIVYTQEYEMRRSGMYTRSSSIPVQDFHEFSIFAGKREDMDRRISDSARLIASFSGVDGAVAITDRLRLMGFGAEIVAPPLVREVFIASDHTADSSFSIRVDQYGTRHRSAFRFCAGGEDSLAFIVSMDSGIKGVKKIGDRLVMWPDITFGPQGI